MMLVLQRNVGKSVVIAGVITVTVLTIEGKRVKLGISAPPDISIVREELPPLSSPSSSQFSQCSLTKKKRSSSR